MSSMPLPGGLCGKRANRRSVRLCRCRCWLADGSALARRPLVHQPLQHERRDTDDDQRTPGQVVVPHAIEQYAAHPGAEERADLMAEKHDAIERIEVGHAEY